MTVPIQTPINSYTADGKTVLFAYKFYTTEYSDLVVEVNGVEQPQSNYTVAGMGGKNGGDVTFKTAPAAGAEVVLFRRTPVGRDSEFINNGDLLAADVNREFDRIWLVQQEQKASTAATLSRPTGGGAWDAQKYRIENVAPATLDTDAVTLGQVKTQNGNAFTSATNADNSAKAAAASAVAAAGSAANAKAESDTAHTAAINANTSQLLAQKAAQDAAADATSAAQTQLTTIITPAVQAAQAAQATAQQNANTAGGYVTDAQGYAQAAAASATGAARSATAAATSETNAAQSEQLAAQYAQTINTTAIMTAVNKKLDLTTWQQTVPTLALKSDLTGLATSAQVQQAIAASSNFVKLSSSTMQTVNSPLYLTGYLTLGAGAALTTDAVAGTDIVNYRSMVDYVKNNVTITGYVDDSTNQDVKGIKTFSQGLRVTYNPQNNTDVVPKSYVDNQIASIQIPSLAGYIDSSTEQDINGNKHFKGKLTAMRPTASDEVVTLGYMGTLLGGMVSKTGDVTVSGVKTFSTGLKVTAAPNGDDDVVNQKALIDTLGNYLSLSGSGTTSVGTDTTFVGKLRVARYPQDDLDVVNVRALNAAVAAAAGKWGQDATTTTALNLDHIGYEGAWLVSGAGLVFGSFGTPPGISSRLTQRPYLVECFLSHAFNNTNPAYLYRITEPETGKVWVNSATSSTATPSGWLLEGGWVYPAITGFSQDINALTSEGKYKGSDIYFSNLPTDASGKVVVKGEIVLEVIGNGQGAIQRLSYVDSSGTSGTSGTTVAGLVMRIRLPTNDWSGWQEMV